MHTELSRQSVVIKCNLEASIMTGNYEFYYAAGLVKKLYGLPVEAGMPPEELFGKLSEQLDSLKPKDEKEEYLLGMLKNYEVLADYDDQMKELFAWGEQEPDLWSVTTDYKPKL